MRHSRILIVALYTLAFLFSASPGWAADENAAFQLSSPALSAGETVPKAYTCHGQDISPPLNWNRGPQGTGSYAVVLEDPDAPGGLFIHWAIVNIPPTVTNLPEGLPRLEQLINSEIQAVNDFGKTGYSGPCPPAGSLHRYRFRLYALEDMLRIKAGVSGRSLQESLKADALASTELEASYSSSL